MEFYRFILGLLPEALFLSRSLIYTLCLIGVFLYFFGYIAANRFEKNNSLFFYWGIWRMLCWVYFQKLLRVLRVRYF